MAGIGLAFTLIHGLGGVMIQGGYTALAGKAYGN